ncbi:diacylglycerol kinase family protein [Schumannella luteola]|uniref:Diacylglycerol kinase family enzyme n=1 Tax=Schumannella luteola TaxID=472059 RepID=A0A852Y8T4_9MICO|nr:diacylglycerol kinase family protein [Schumannella luteola]NYG97790.1 diacylglycerol kinase family enzyme [Schumannella luteola]TPX02945.1 diacylglycerol kinase [Schumannella luteola]
MTAPSDAPKSRRAAIVFNPIKVDEQRLRTAIAAAEAEHGWGETLWLETSVEDPGQGPTRQAVAEGVEVVIAAGGDGTVRAVAEALRGTDTALALLPSGTGNLLARNLDLNLAHVEGSIETAFTGEDRKIDLGVARLEREDGSREEHAFLVMAGIGIDAQMVVNTNAELKKKVGWIAYVDAIVRSLRDRDRLRIRYELDDGPAGSMSVHTLLVGNCGSLPGNILLLPEAAVDDGDFDIVALRPEGFFGWLQIWTKIVWENGVLRRSQAGRKLMSLTKEVRTLRYLKGKQFTVRIEKPDEFELDGDLFGEVVAFRTTVDPLALEVRLPAGHRLSTDQPESAVRA